MQLPKTHFSVSCICVCIHFFNSERLFFRVPQWDLFSGPYWKHYHRKRIASDPAMLYFPVCFLLCLWFSLDLLQLWFILIFCSGIYCLSLRVPCVLLSVTSRSCGIILGWHAGFCLCSEPMALLGQVLVRDRFWLGVSLTWSFCHLFFCYHCFSEPEKSTKIQCLLALNNVSYADRKLIFAFSDWEVKRNWKRKYLLRRLKGLAGVKAENHRYFGLKLPYKCQMAQVMELS